MSSQTQSGEQVWVGDCPEHGYLIGNEVDVQFPNKAKCSCGRELEQATRAAKSEVMARAE